MLDCRLAYSLVQTPTRINYILYRTACHSVRLLLTVLFSFHLILVHSSFQCSQCICWAAFCNDITISFICYILWSWGLHNKTWKSFHSKKVVTVYCVLLLYFLLLVFATENNHQMQWQWVFVYVYSFWSLLPGGLTHRIAPNGYTKNHDDENNVIVKAKHKLIVRIHDMEIVVFNHQAQNTRQFITITYRWLLKSINTQTHTANAHLCLRINCQHLERDFFSKDTILFDEILSAMFFFSFHFALLLPVISIQWAVVADFDDFFLSSSYVAIFSLFRLVDSK